MKEIEEDQELDATELRWSNRWSTLMCNCNENISQVEVDNCWYTVAAYKWWDQKASYPTRLGSGLQVLHIDIFTIAWS